MAESDSVLLTRYRQGDVRALERLVEQYRRPLFSFILGMAKNNEEANDLFQEVWLRAIRNLDRYEDRRLLSWLFRIAHNLVVDRVRKHHTVISLEQENKDGVSLGNILPDGSRPPSQRAGDDELGQLIAAAVARLPPEQKEVFLMRAQADMPFKEIARIQQVSVNTALARMQYALGKLRALLQDQGATMCS